jgi:hypothetical protein
MQLQITRNFTFDIGQSIFLSIAITSERQSRCYLPNVALSTTAASTAPAAVFK